jgi:NAD/NADP transhydrogenase alpha subunit
VALTPVAVATLIKKGFSVNVEDGAGLESRFRNEDYAGAGAKVVDKNAAFHSGCNIQCSSYRGCNARFSCKMCRMSQKNLPAIAVRNFLQLLSLL